MEVEVYVQEDVYELSQPETVNISESADQMTADTWKNRFNLWLEMLQPDLPPAPAYEIGLRLTNDTEIQTLNTQYRHQNKPTDVLSFASLEVDFPQSDEMLGMMPLYLGDIVISVDTARRQAQQQDHPLSTELAWLASHGLLHLLGWDHPDEDSLSRMLKQQVVLLKKVGIEINLEE